MTALRTTRIARGLTQSELAEILGVHRQTVNRWERGAIGIHPAMREKIERWIEG